MLHLDSTITRAKDWLVGFLCLSSYLGVKSKLAKSDCIAHLRRKVYLAGTVNVYVVYVHTRAANGGGGRSITLALAKSLSVAVSLSPKSELALPLDCLFSLRLGGIIIGAGARRGHFLGCLPSIPIFILAVYLHNSV